MQMDLNRYRGLYHAAIKGDWKSAKGIIDSEKDALRANISILKMNALQIAAGSGHSHFVEQLARLLPSEALAVKDSNRGTALCHASVCGSLKTVKAMVRRNKDLTEIKGVNDHIPLMSAAIMATEKQRKSVWYLYLKTKNPFPDRTHIELPLILTHAGLHDIALHLLQRYPEKATETFPTGSNLLTLLAKKPSDFLSGTRLTFWERWIYKFSPDTLPHSAKGDTDDPGENLAEMSLVVQVLQSISRAPPLRLSSVSGPALQMQRELQWFKEVEKLIKPEFKDLRNKQRKTARELFKEKHKDLVARGETWMKDTSNSCMVVTILFANVVFAAAFTVPGGNSSQGIPIFLGGIAFKVFVISDALALLSSLTSLLMFLSILTARYAEEYFIKSLPLRLIIGLASLFFAIATVVIAFVATLWIVLDNGLRWVTIPITILAAIPVTLFAILRLRLFIQMFHSTCGSGIFRPQKLW